MSAGGNQPDLDARLVEDRPVQEIVEGTHALLRPMHSLLIDCLATFLV